jgi:spore maturation protein B
MLRASGALDLFVNFLSPLANSLGFPAQVLPLMLLRPISGSGSIAVVDSIFKTCGVDSFAGRVASVMSGSTETTFYAIAVYYGSVGIRKTRHTIPAALSADIVGFIISVLSVNILFNL